MERELEGVDEQIVILEVEIGAYLYTIHCVCS